MPEFREPPLGAAWSRRWRRNLLAALALVLAVAAAPLSAGDADAPAPAPAGDGKNPILIGMLFPYSGPLSQLGDSARIGAKCRVDEINAAGGVDGRPLELVHAADFGDDARKMIASYNTLAGRPEIMAVIGPITSGMALSLRDTAKERGLAVLAPDATVTGLVRGQGDWLFAGSAENGDQAGAVARYLIEDRDIKTAGVLVNDRSPYAIELAECFSQAFAALGGTVVRTEKLSLPRREDSAADFYPGLAALVADKPGALYLAVDSEDVPPVFRRLAGLDYPGLCVGGDSWDWPYTFSSSGNRILGSVFAGGFSADNPDAYRRAIIRRLYAAGARMIDNPTVTAYDAVRLLAAAMEKGGVSRQGVHDGWFGIGEIALACGERARVDPEGHIHHDIFLNEIVADERVGSRPRMIRVISAAPDGDKP